MRVAIIGAGPAGLTAALALARGGVSVDVYEAGNEVGGLCRSLDLWGHRVDLGPHRFFSTDRRINEFWLSIVGRDYRMVDRLTRVHFRDKLISYPIRPLDAMGQVGLVDAVKCFLSYISQQFHTSQDQNHELSFESWVTTRFGKRLYELFFRSYSEKLWGIRCDQLSADFAAQRIRQFSLWEAIVSSLSPSRARKHKTIADQFAYPIGGTGAVYKKIAKEFVAFGGRLHLQSPIECIGRIESGGCELEVADGLTEKFDHVISTMPLTKLIDGISRSSTNVPAAVHAAAGKLRFRNTILTYLHVDSPALFNDQWLYIQSPNVNAGRVTNFRNWIPELYSGLSTSVLAVEWWCDHDDPRWTDNDSSIVAQCANELISLGLLTDEKVLDGHVMRLARSYPVYELGYKQHLSCIAEYLSQFKSITPIGRYGAFKYNNQDHSILMGLRAAEKLLSGTDQELWGINSDFSHYQEATKISETGLVLA